MREGSEKSPITLPGAVQLSRVNKRIAEITHANPHRNAYQIFALTGRLARQAVDTALEIQMFPGVEARQLEPVLNFWYRFSDYARTAALNCAGGNQTLAEALITFQLMQTLGEKDP